MIQVWTQTAMWLGQALIATLFSIWFKVETALSGIVVGTIAQLFIAAAGTARAVDDSAACPSTGAISDCGARWRKTGAARSVILRPMHYWSELLGDGVLVALGATVGTPARFFISGLVARRFGETIPWGTLVVNATGCLIMGLVGAVAQAYGLSGASAFWLLGATGFLGSYTTVSSFALQTRALVRDGERRLALGYIALSVILCLAAVAAGFEVGRAILAGVAR